MGKQATPATMPTISADRLEATGNGIARGFMGGFLKPQEEKRCRAELCEDERGQHCRGAPVTSRRRLIHRSITLPAGSFTKERQNRKPRPACGGRGLGACL